MAEHGTITFKGKSGEGYKYWIYDLSDTHAAVPANYIFVKETKPNSFRPIYIGETEDISDRFDNHHKMPCIKRNGASHLCAHKSSADKKVRCAEEADLVANYSPICND